MKYFLKHTHVAIKVIFIRNSESRNAWLITSLEQIRAGKMLHAGFSRGHLQNLIAESADLEALIVGNGLHPHWTLRKLCKDQSGLDA